MENPIEESNIYKNMNDEEISRKELQDKLNSGEDSSTHQINQETTSESTKQNNEMETMENMDEESKDLADDQVTF